MMSDTAVGSGRLPVISVPAGCWPRHCARATARRPERRSTGGGVVAFACLFGRLAGHQHPA
jgi:hypothetical protein